MFKKLANLKLKDIPSEAIALFSFAFIICVIFYELFLDEKSEKKYRASHLCFAKYGSLCPNKYYTGGRVRNRLK